MIGKQELVEFLAEKCKMTKVLASEVYDAVCGNIRAHMLLGDDVVLRGVGMFRVVQRRARKGHNPFTNKPVQVPARRAMKFMFSPTLKLEVRDVKVKAKPVAKPAIKMAVKTKVSPKVKKTSKK